MEVSGPDVKLDSVATDTIVVDDVMTSSEETELEFQQWVLDSELLVECAQCGLPITYARADILAIGPCCTRKCAFGLMKEREGITYYGYGEIGKRVWALRMRRGEFDRAGNRYRNVRLLNRVEPCVCGSNHKVTICFLE